MKSSTIWATRGSEVRSLRESSSGFGWLRLLLDFVAPPSRCRVVAPRGELGLKCGRVLSVSLLSLVLLLSGCADKAPDVTPDPLTPTAYIHFVETGPLVYGELRRARITVTNSTFQPILFRSVELEGQLPFVYRSPEPLLGELRFKDSTGHFTYDSEAEAETESVFLDNMLLLPGENLSVEQDIRLRFGRQRIKILFQRIPTFDLAEQVYFPTADPKNKDVVRFRRLRPSERKSYRSGQPGTLERVVIVPDSSRWPTEESTLTARLMIQDTGVPTTLEGLEAFKWSKVTLWQGAGLWVVDDPRSKRIAAYEEDGTSHDLPHCDLRIFDVLDRRDRESEEVRVAIYKSATDDHPEAVHLEDMLDFFETVRKNEDELHPYWAEREDGTYFYGILRMKPVISDQQ